MNYKNEEEIEYKGYWWLPDKPQEKIVGTLKIAPNGKATLELTGSFTDIGHINKMLKPDIILGFSSDGKQITLYKCIETRKNASIPGFPISLFKVGEVFIGAHFNKADDIKFKKLFVHFIHLDDWVNFFIFEVNEKNGKEITIKSKLGLFDLPGVEANVNGYKISIKIQTITYAGQKEIRINQKTFLTIEHEEEVPLGEYWRMVYHIQNFLSLAMNFPVYPLAIVGITKTNQQVRIYPFLMKPYETTKAIHFSDMLFTLRDIYDKFGTFLENWFKKLSIMEPVFDLYFGTLYNPQMHLKHQFLNLIHAIEVYHRRKFGGKYIPDRKYEDLYKKLTEVINGLKVEAPFREALKSKLKYGNEYSLRKRLKELFKEYGDIFDDFVQDRDKFIEKIVNTRNYLTHYDQSLEEKALEGEELYYAIRQLKTILISFLLREIGFDSNEIKRIISYLVAIYRL